MSKLMKDEDWDMRDVVREFGPYCKHEDLVRAVMEVLGSKDKKGKNTYKKKMDCVRVVLRNLGYKDIPYRTDYYRKELNNERL